MMRSLAVSLGVLSVLACLAGALGGGGPVGAMPVYGTARYGRPAWAYRPAYYRPPYPYAHDYPEDLYYQPQPVMRYPYYPVAGHYADQDAYRYPYMAYYNDRMRPYTGYYGNDETYEPTEEDARTDLRVDATGVNERAESLPVGQETWFEGQTPPRWRNDYDDVNAAFLQNLIVTQMYKDAAAKGDGKKPVDDRNVHRDTDENDDRRSPEYYGERDIRDFEDEDVRELKALAGKPMYHVPKTKVYTPMSENDNSDYRRQPQQWYPEISQDASSHEEEEDHYPDDYQNDESWINWNSKRSDKNAIPDERKIKVTVAASTTTVAPSTASPQGGQKELVQLRPATPARRPFPAPVMHMLAASAAPRKRTPSVYDTIKQLLSMEESLKPNSDIKPRVQKRFVTTEEDLVGELKGLKRRSIV